MNVILTLAVFLVGILAVSERFRRLSAIDNATREHRIAMGFVRDEECSAPHEFAACWLAGNRMAIESKFPEFAAYRAACLRDIDKDADQ
jgi:hypothetical protein